METYMQRKSNPLLTKRAQHLRQNMTKEERKLWFDFFKQLKITVNRQHTFGQYIVDFYIASAKLVIELDGSQHYEPGGIQYDSARDAYLQGLGLKVLHYANSDVNTKFSSVCEDILEQIRLRAK